MNILSQEYNNSLCEVRGMANDVYIVGRIREITNYYIKIASSNQNLPVIFVNTPVKIQIYNEEFGFCMISGLVYISSEDFVEITDTKIVTDKERRKFFRVPIQLKTKACIFAEDGGKIKLEEDDWFDITVNNIGLGGIYLLTKRELEKGDNIAVKVKLTSGDILMYKIVNKIVADKNGKIMGYGCNIVYSDNKTADELCAHIFEWQRKLISEAKGF